MNSLNIMGRLASEPEVRLTANQKTFCSFRIAVDSGKDKDPYFFPCIAWNATATNIQKFFHKGNKIAISGILTSRTYEDKEGNKKAIIEILVNNFDFCDSKKTEQTEQPAEQPQTAQTPAEQTEQQGELPFEI